MSPAVELLGRLRGLGIEVWPHGDRLRFRPKAAVTPALAKELAARKAEVLAELRRQQAPLLPKPGDVVLTPEMFKVRTIDDLLDLWDESQPRTRCYLCRGTAWWRLRTSGPWVCGRCHPPVPPPDAIEWRQHGERYD